MAATRTILLTVSSHQIQLMASSKSRKDGRSDRGARPRHPSASHHLCIPTCRAWQEAPTVGMSSTGPDKMMRMELGIELDQLVVREVRTSGNVGRALAVTSTVGGGKLAYRSTHTRAPGRGLETRTPGFKQHHRHIYKDTKFLHYGSVSDRSTLQDKPTLYFVCTRRYIVHSCT